MRIMTYNTLHCAAYRRDMTIDFPAYAEVIRSLSPDVATMQEIRSAGAIDGYEDQTLELSRLTGMPYYRFAEAIRFRGLGPYGNAIISHLPIASSEVIMIPDPEVRRNPKGYYETRCLLKAKLECGITVMTVHFGLNSDEKENAMRTVLEHIEDEKCILTGDFNMTPDNPLFDALRERMCDTGELLADEGFTFSSDAPHRKIDYIFTSRDLKVTRVEVPKIIVSDHLPIVADIDF